jgi:hypothetical protein
MKKIVVSSSDHLYVYDKNYIWEMNIFPYEKNYICEMNIFPLFFFQEEWIFSYHNTKQYVFLIFPINLIIFLRKKS